ncbi:MAG: diacylglycerol kinase family lipid kinase [Clostridia bacterium]|nr:diacylglycerol kinase family lipid kinase [Clostridia bacterium]
MKHIFLINPNCGKNFNAEEFIREKIVPACEKNKIDYFVYHTTGPGDSTRYCDEYAKEHPDEQIRFYACGGDGSVYEAVNGLYKHDNTELAIVPVGSGNDFIKIFASKEDFLDIEASIKGTPIKLDLIDCGKDVSINIASMGFCAESCSAQAEMKKYASGHMSYVLGGFKALRYMKNDMKVIIDGKTVSEGPIVFAVCANSRFYGSGIKVAPFALPDDGLLDFVVAESGNMNFPQLAKFLLVDWQKNFTHIYNENCRYYRGKEMQIIPKKPGFVNVDGETYKTSGVTFKLMPSAINFVVPSNSTYLEDRKSGKISNEIKI